MFANKDVKNRLIGQNKIENLILEFLTSLYAQKIPSFSLQNSSSWANVSFTEEKGLETVAKPTLKCISLKNLSSFNKIGRILKVLSIIYSNLQSNSHSSKRDIYYQDPRLFGRQGVLDGVVEDICLILSMPRSSLHVHASGKGLVAGHLSFIDHYGNHINCMDFPMGLTIPSNIEDVTEMKTKARMVLVVEKDASFQHILQASSRHTQPPSIILTGKGFPDVNTRSLVRILSSRFHLPIYCLVDADPYGVEIMSVYRYGSRALSHENHRLAVPEVEWLGILPSDIDRMHIPREALLPLTTRDIKKVHDMMARNPFRSHAQWKIELETMLRAGVKAEIQCLDAISKNFLVDVYLPEKIKHM